MMYNSMNCAYGATFICCICAINSNISKYLWNDLNFQEGLGIVLLIYITGMILQEVGSVVDRKITRLYIGMHRSILKGIIDDRYRKETLKEEIDKLRRVQAIGLCALVALACIGLSFLPVL